MKMLDYSCLLIFLGKKAGSLVRKFGDDEHEGMGDGKRCFPSEKNVIEVVFFRRWADLSGKKQGESIEKFFSEWYNYL